MNATINLIKTIIIEKITDTTINTNNEELITHMVGPLGIDIKVKLTGPDIIITDNIVLGETRIKIADPEAIQKLETTLETITQAYNQQTKQLTKEE